MFQLPILRSSSRCIDIHAGFDSNSNKAHCSGASIIASALCAAVLGAFAAGCSGRKTSQSDYPVVVTTPVEARDVNIYGEYVGRIGAQQSVEVRARVEGYLQKMLFKEGSFVKRGQTLFIIDPTIYRARTARAEAQLNKAKAVATKAKRDLDRIRPLYEANAASQLDLDNAVAAYEGAEADVAVCQADLTQARLTLGYTTVQAPISGYISQRSADLGTLVGPSAQSLLATVVKSDTVRVDFSMPSLDYLKSMNSSVKLGSPGKDDNWQPYVTVTLADGKVYPFKGIVDFADPRVDPKTGTFSVRAEMPNPDHILLPGEFTKVKLLMDVRDSAVVVPSKSLTVDKGGAFIFVVRPDSVVEKRFIETGPEIGNDIIVERGLLAGERIVTEGFHKLRHGSKVAPADVASDESGKAKKDTNKPTTSAE